jgi:hypothetical protein
MRKFLLTLFTLVGVFFTSNTFAQDWEEIVKVLPDSSGIVNSYDYFGESVAFDGNFAVIGSPGSSNKYGYAYVLYYSSEWSCVGVLRASDGDLGDHFGNSVSISANTIVVGAYYSYGNVGASGSVYVFTKPESGWTDMTQTAKLIPSDGNSYNYFGRSVSISNDNIAVGADQDDDSGTKSGSAYVFVKPASGWIDMSQTAKLTASDGTSNDHFGKSVSISGNNIVVGAYNDDGKGSVRIFIKPEFGWADMTETTKLSASDGALGDCFGSSVCISGDYIAVGATGDDDNGSNSGSVYVFTKPESGWTDLSQTAKLIASDGAENNSFGCSVGISENNIVVGASSENGYEGIHIGYAYVFTEPETGWTDMSQTAKLIASDEAENDFFGCSVGISGANIIVGAKHDDDNERNSGSVYIYEKPESGWIDMSQNQKFIADLYKGNINDRFGVSVSIDEDYAAIGAPGYSNGKGCVYVLYNTGHEWEYLGILTASDGSTVDKFGNSVSISGNHIVVGAEGADDNGYSSGSAYVFTKPETGWMNMIQTAKLTASDGAAYYCFGNSVSISGDFIVVGSRADEVNGSQSGSAYVFAMSESGWVDMTQIAKLTASDAYKYDHFGKSVSISGNNIVIGANGNDDNGEASGSVYVFTKPETGWDDMTETAKMTQGDRYDHFGISVSISGDYFVVGAYGDDSNGDMVGAAYIYTKPATGWYIVAPTAKLTPSDGEMGDQFGASVSISGDNIVIGANRDDDNGNNSGSVYVFAKPETGWADVSQIAKLKASDGAESDDFGVSVSIFGNNIIVGAYGDDDYAEYGGSAYLFQYGNQFEFNDNICEGEDFIYTISNQEADATFQWQNHVGNAWEDITEETSDKLIVPDVGLDMNGSKYRCIISATENDTSDVAALTVNESYLLPTLEFVCSGDSYTFPDGTTKDNLTSPIVYNSNLQSITGCDSIIETSIQIKPNYNLTETVEINSGESFTFPDGTSQTNITTQVVYTSNLQTVFGCDSIIETTVNVEDNSTDLFTKVIIDEAANFILPVSAQLGDYDNDGDQDILVADTMENIYIYKNELNSYSREVSMPINWGTSSEFVRWFDYDNDDDLDVVYVGDDTPGVRLFQNDNGNYSEVLIESFKAAQYGSLNVGDFNNDGFKDMLISGSNSFDDSNQNISLTQIIQNNGISFSEVYENLLTGSDGSATWGDFDNDNYLDVVLCGSNYDDNEEVSKIYKNTGSSFVEIYPNSLAKAEWSRIACADYNNDGLLDILLFGSDWHEYDGGESFTKLYKNTGTGFTEVLEANISGAPFASAWGDYDNDGDLDLVLSGDKIFRNDGDDIFTQVYYDALQENYGRSCWGDYDKDGDLDIISVYGNLMIYVNNSESKNNPALAPQNTSSDILDKEATLKWNKTTDTETPQDGLTYTIEVYKNSKSKAKILYAKIERIQYCENGYTLKNLPQGQYYWKVQAFDTGLKGGEFSVEKSFIIGESSGNTYYESESICDGETYTHGTQELSTQGEYTETFTATDGSDSTVVLSLTVNPAYNLTEKDYILTGESYTFPDGSTQNNITSQVIYISNLRTAFGCDSIIETTVNVGDTEICYSSESVTVCSGSDYTFPDGTTQYDITSQVVYESYIESIDECDKIIEITVNVNPTDVTNLTETICQGENIKIAYGLFSYTGLYGITLKNEFGCDSVIKLDLTVVDLQVNLGSDVSINLDDTLVLDAGEDFETYYWNTEETSQTVEIDGAIGIGAHIYNVRVTDLNSCVASDTIIITVNSLTDIGSINNLEGRVKVYPNPTSDKLNIELVENAEVIEISLFDIIGNLLIQKEMNSEETKRTIEIPGESGVYFIRIRSEFSSKTFKIIKN